MHNPVTFAPGSRRTRFRFLQQSDVFFAMLIPGTFMADRQGVGHEYETRSFRSGDGLRLCFRDYVGELAQMPTLLVHGELSDVLTADIIGQMQQSKKDLEVIVVPNRGHAPLLNEPEALDAITRFVAAN